MTIQYCSDLHLEFTQNKKYLTKNLLKPKGEILLLAGDIVPFEVVNEHDDFLIISQIILQLLIGCQVTTSITIMILIIKMV